MILWASGGIGIRARLKIAFRKDCGFKSHLAHHSRLHFGQFSTVHVAAQSHARQPVSVRVRPVPPYSIEKINIKVYNKLDFS
jgi:hypothetical protein